MLPRAPKDLVLHGIRVLELVDERRGEAAPHRRGERAAVSAREGLLKAQEQIVEGERRCGVLTLGELRADVRDEPLLEPQRVLVERRRERRVRCEPRVHGVEEGIGEDAPFGVLRERLVREARKRLAGDGARARGRAHWPPHKALESWSATAERDETIPGARRGGTLARARSPARGPKRARAHRAQARSDGERSGCRREVSNGGQRGIAARLLGQSRPPVGVSFTSRSRSSSSAGKVAVSRAQKSCKTSSRRGARSVNTETSKGMVLSNAFS